MPTLNWIGKDKVVSHHQDVPYRVLEHKYGFTADPSTGSGHEQTEPTNSGNKIIHGDNLEALKSLLPEYEGKIKCIYIDPPYNTGNENWVYNDNVNHPKIKKWLGEVVGKDGEDLTRHDKWLCMMYPRVRMLQKLMARDGLIFMSLDDNELENGLFLLNDIFGKKNKLACAPWLAEPSGGKEKRWLRNGHEYILIYHNGSADSVTQEERSSGKLDLKDNQGKYKKGRELRKWGGASQREDRPGQWFPLTTPSGEIVWPHKNDGTEGHWRWGKEQKMQPIIENPNVAHWELCSYDSGVVVGGKTERWVPFEKIRDVKKMVGWTTWLNSVGYNSDGTSTLKNIFGHKIFDTPKPVSLIEWLISLHSDESALVLDSFAGSGTTAHAVLNLNKQDGGNRKFILVEMEDYANDITAERVKRVSKGYGSGNKKVEGTGGAFDFYELGLPLFDENQNLNEEVGLPKIREYIWFSETRTSFKEPNKEPYFLGIKDESVYYFIYEKEKLTTLDYDALELIKTKGEQYIIYADNCLLPKEFMAKNNIIFKKIPRDITRF
ncbi:site-specific DNA-methyltransferase [Moheibacter lacus]|uniref:site-specific DNA-methyltransferase (adenine-specific) n=1 Tax=Moheibacter lacus TaxID=2745851 RepID=A0A838ZSP4_9FLAO|nr:site-specific DNA-methyltransferase [Moheibacter lacus]MBA5629991.1 site-specific DNA-methyltransferase [Moheibacter lacus]